MSVGTDPANELNDAVTRAVKYFKKSNKEDDQDFARTVAKRAYNIKTDKKRYAAARALGSIEAKSGVRARKRVRSSKVLLM